MASKPKFVLARRDAELQRIQLHKSRHAQSLEETTISNLSSFNSYNGEGGPANVLRALTFRPKDTSFQSSRSTEISGDQPSDVIVNETQFNFNTVHKQTQNKDTIQTEPTQFDAKRR